MQFNIFAQLDTELNDFIQNKVHIAGATGNKGAKYLSKNDTGYEFSQWETLNNVEMFYNSKFNSGELDSEGQRKVFLNVSQFRADVASKQVDIDVKDFVFIPSDSNGEWGAYFMGKKFKQWAKKSYFGELINQVVNDYPKYGTAVLKRVGKELVRVPLLTLRNQQDAKDLKTARYVIEVLEKMNSADIEAMKEWDSSKLKLNFGEEVTVYERHGAVPLDYFKTLKGEEVEEGDEFKTIETMAILVPSKDDQKKAEGGAVLFIEQEDERPYEEVHWKRQDGRWLGMGEVENQFENQIVRNMLANMRRKNLNWSSKKIFQSADPDITKNLVRDVRDGEVLKINPNGNITQIDMATRSVGEFQSAEEVWDRNSDQKSFTFEVATGEALPSGTPFRLGVVLSNAVNTHFNLKRENLGLFFCRVMDNLIIPIFKKENSKAHTIPLFSDEEGVEVLKQALAENKTNQMIKDTMLSGTFPDAQAIKAKVEEEIAKMRSVYMEIGDKFYDDLNVTTQLVITGENVDLPKKIETLTNLYNTLAQRQDPRAEKVLARTIALTGENFDIIAGAQQPQNVPQGTNPMAQLGGMPQQPANTPTAV